MCVICNPDNVVMCISLIPGFVEVPSHFHVYFPWQGELPSISDTLTEKQLKMQG